MTEQIKAAVDHIKSRYDGVPEIGIVLGSGLGNFVNEIAIEKEIPYADIPHFPVSTVHGHSGKLVFGTVRGKKVVAMAGRFHYYEGYTAQQTVFPIRVMKYLGIQTLILSNAAGGVNPAFKVGDLMIITDHISQLTPNPLIGKNDPELGPRFPDMSEPYKKVLIDKMKAIAAAQNIPVHQGVYVAVTGPTFETPAEYRMIAAMGGDAVGMSTVPEVIAAVHMGLPVFAMSVITDIALHEGGIPVSHEEVLNAAKAAEPKFAALIDELIAQL
ncbi:MAG: purine-nucleoside phosphorylase [Chitinophagaceae bacterium]|nr:purine-nucleoside phosphorylase [Chitinophagaceae bacterium]MBL0056378.1 purine-nucleoside phosphorylase [Chitinophagaceae bacterium]